MVQSSLLTVTSLSGRQNGFLCEHRGKIGREGASYSCITSSFTLLSPEMSNILAMYPQDCRDAPSCGTMLQSIWLVLQACWHPGQILVRSAPEGRLFSEKNSILPSQNEHLSMRWLRSQFVCGWCLRRNWESLCLGFALFCGFKQDGEGLVLMCWYVLIFNLGPAVWKWVLPAHNRTASHSIHLVTFCTFWTAKCFPAMLLCPSHLLLYPSHELW